MSHTEDCRLSFVGRIRLDRQFICAEPDLAHYLLCQGIIVRAVAATRTSDYIEYTMFAPHLFRELSEGEMVPLYDLTIGVTEEGMAEIVALEEQTCENS